MPAYFKTITMSKEGKRDQGFLNHLRSEYITLLLGLGSFIVIAPKFMNQLRHIIGCDFSTSFYLFLLLYFFLPVAGAILWLYVLNTENDGLKLRLLDKGNRELKIFQLPTRNYLKITALLLLLNASLLFCFAESLLWLNGCLSLIIYLLVLFYFIWIWRRYNAEGKRYPRVTFNLEFKRRLRQIHWQYAVILTGFFALLAFILYYRFNSPKEVKGLPGAALVNYENHYRLKESLETALYYHELISHELDPKDSLLNKLTAAEKKLAFASEDSLGSKLKNILSQRNWIPEAQQAKVKDSSLMMTWLNATQKATTLGKVKHDSVMMYRLCEAKKTATLANVKHDSLLTAWLHAVQKADKSGEVRHDTVTMIWLCTLQKAGMLENMKRDSLLMALLRAAQVDAMSEKAKRTSLLMAHLKDQLSLLIEKNDLVTKEYWCALLNQVQLKGLLVLSSLLLLLLAIWYHAYRENLLYNLNRSSDEEEEFSEIPIATKCIYMSLLLMLPFFRMIDAKKIDLDKPFIKPIANEKIWYVHRETKDSILPIAIGPGTADTSLIQQLRRLTTAGSGSVTLDPKFVDDLKKQINRVPHIVKSSAKPQDKDSKRDQDEYEKNY